MRWKSWSKRMGGEGLRSERRESRMGAPWQRSRTMHATGAPNPRADPVHRSVALTACCQMVPSLLALGYHAHSVPLLAQTPPLALDFGRGQSVCLAGLPPISALCIIFHSQVCWMAAVVQCCRSNFFMITKGVYSCLHGFRTGVWSTSSSWLLLIRPPHIDDVSNLLFYACTYLPLLLVLLCCRFQVLHDNQKRHCMFTYACI